MNIRPPLLAIPAKLLSSLPRKVSTPLSRLMLSGTLPTELPEEPSASVIGLRLNTALSYANRVNENTRKLESGEDGHERNSYYELLPRADLLSYLGDSMRHLQALGLQGSNRGISLKDYLVEDGSFGSVNGDESLLRHHGATFSQAVAEGRFASVGELEAEIATAILSRPVNSPHLARLQRELVAQHAIRKTVLDATPIMSAKTAEKLAAVFAREPAMSTTYYNDFLIP